MKTRVIQVAVNLTFDLKREDSDSPECDEGSRLQLLPWLSCVEFVSEFCFCGLSDVSDLTQNQQVTTRQ
jgi:hypothetical protein